VSGNRICPKKLAETDVEVPSDLLRRGKEKAI